MEPTNCNRIMYICLYSMKAKKKKVDTMNAADMGIDLTPNYEILEILEPPPRKAGIMVSDVDELLDKLRNEAKVLK